jgi:rhodanese-related sulfurtransferase
MPDNGTFRQVSVPDALAIADGRRIIDVRELVEWNEGHIPTATLVPLADLAATIETVVPDKSTPILVHCAVGARSMRAAAYMAQLGYTDVVNIQGRLAEWKALGGAWDAPAQLLTDAQRARYSRQLLIPEIGQAGQRKLLDARVLPSAPVGSDRRRGCTWPRPGSGRWVSWTMTSWTSRTSSARCSTPRTGSGCRRPSPPR